MKLKSVLTLLCLFLILKLEGAEGEQKTSSLLDHLIKGDFQSIKEFSNIETLVNQEIPIPIKIDNDTLSNLNYRNTPRALRPLTIALILTDKDPNYKANEVIDTLIQRGAEQDFTSEAGLQGHTPFSYVWNADNNTTPTLQSPSVGSATMRSALLDLLKEAHKQQTIATLQASPARILSKDLLGVIGEFFFVPKPSSPHCVVGGPGMSPRIGRVNRYELGAGLSC